MERRSFDGDLQDHTFRVARIREGFIPSEIATGSYIVDPNGASRYKLPGGIDRRGLQLVLRSGVGSVRPLHYRFAQATPGNVPRTWNRLRMTLGVSQTLGSDQRRRLPMGGPRNLRTLGQYGASSIDYPIFRGHPNNHHERRSLRNGGSWEEARRWLRSVSRRVRPISRQGYPSQKTIQYDRPVASVQRRILGLEKPSRAL